MSKSLTFSTYLLDIPGYYFGDFHWYRKDDGGFWSHKQSYGKVRRARDGITNEHIYNPKHANLGGKYKFVTYMRCNPGNVNIEGVGCPQLVYF